MSAKHLHNLLFLALLSVGSIQACGDDEEEGEAGAEAGKAKGKAKASKGGSKGDEGSGMVNDLADRTVTQGPSEELVPLEDAPVVSDPGSAHTGSCAHYIDCVCNLETAIVAARPQEPALGDCSRVKTAFENTTGRDGECLERHGVYKTWIASQEFMTDGISVPESCR
jgi:hypothetical protein